MLWLAFVAHQGAEPEGQGIPRDDVEGDDVEGVGGATGSVRVFLMATKDTRIVCGVPVALDTRTRNTVKNSFALNFLTVGPLQSPCGLVS